MDAGGHVVLGVRGEGRRVGLQLPPEALPGRVHGRRRLDLQDELGLVP